jgi:hypothetical protein
MRYSAGLAVALAAGLMAAPVMAQTNGDTGKKPETSSSSKAMKGPASGAPVGSQPQTYGKPSDQADKQKVSGMPVGASPPKYGPGPKNE